MVNGSGTHLVNFNDTSVFPINTPEKRWRTRSGGNDRGFIYVADSRTGTASLGTLGGRSDASSVARAAEAESSGLDRRNDDTTLIFFHQYQPAPAFKTTVRANRRRIRERISLSPLS